MENTQLIYVQLCFSVDTFDQLMAYANRHMRTSKWYMNIGKFYIVNILQEVVR